MTVSVRNAEGRSEQCELRLESFALPDREDARSSKAAGTQLGWSEIGGHSRQGSFQCIPGSAPPHGRRSCCPPGTFSNYREERAGERGEAPKQLSNASCAYVATVHASYKGESCSTGGRCPSCATSRQRSKTCERLLLQPAAVNPGT